MVPVGTQGVGSIHTPNIGPIDEGWISISSYDSRPQGPVQRIKRHGISYDGSTNRELQSSGGLVVVILFPTEYKQ